MPLPTKATEIPVPVADSNSVSSPSRSLSPQEIKIMESKNIQNQQKQIIESKYSSSPSLTASSASSASSTSFDGPVKPGADSDIKPKRTISEHQPPLKKSRKAPNSPSLKSLKRVPLGNATHQSHIMGNQQSYYVSPIQVSEQIPVQGPVSNLNLSLNSPVYTFQTQFLAPQLQPQPQRQLVYSPNIGRMVSIPISQGSSSSSFIGQQTPVMMFQQIPVIHSPYNPQLIPSSVPVVQQHQLSQKSPQLKKQQNSNMNISKSPLTSDVYDYEHNNDDENGIAGDYEEDVDNDDDDDDDDDDDGDDDDNDDNDNGEGNVEDNAISQDDKEISSKLLWGSITLDGWHSKFTIPMSGNEVEDKKHFDVIMTNAWKSSLSSRK